ncbi:hypothetical protein PPTG_23797 [Phytophthora nicotianae INRA-310]|uniref:Uncharacterized protein n=1 Tax=Phytophthora nicotianae (strain INRA-310) TaxID=761204 RepID=W2PU37_PHYN3|nr:hypothetical protein PPTG_23797 [Phytophthora nicotianae INRA-310]ETN03540.1 hypothetical protein PPTG_23797 [Phytophthora nicotianae INRA-310]
MQTGTNHWLFYIIIQSKWGSREECGREARIVLPKQKPVVDFFAIYNLREKATAITECTMTLVTVIRTDIFQLPTYDELFNVLREKFCGFVRGIAVTEGITTKNFDGIARA